MEASLAQKNVKKRRREDRKFAYFSMEVGIDSRIPTYSGGLGVLAGDTIRACADLEVPLVAVTLLYKKGYFSQTLHENGEQQEMPAEWDPSEFMTCLKEKVCVNIENREVIIQAWQYKAMAASGYFVPVIFLDTDLESNTEFDRSLSYHLYGGDQRYRIAQEVILGIGGVRMLRELGFNHIHRYHMNEGHSAFLTLELLRELRTEDEDNSWDIDDIRKMCVFTTHTPVPAGHDQFSYEQVQNVLGDFMPRDVLSSLGGHESLNMTLLALNLSGYVNGVAKEHSKVSGEMFPGYKINSITNGVHSVTWVCDSYKRLYDTYISGWRNDSFSLRYALSIPKQEIWDAHEEAKKNLIGYLNEKQSAGMESDVLTIGFARRATAYKRADLVFFDTQRLVQIAKKVGKMQFVFAGKAHPYDCTGKELIKKIYAVSRELKGAINIVYLENYDMKLAEMVISGVDLWLNTPRKPQEASGTSGMKAAHNGIPSVSILNGWWIEGCIEGITGWAIDCLNDSQSIDHDNAHALYDKLERIIIPTFYNNRQSWIEIMRNAIAINASFFNTHRMVEQYVLSAYSY